MYYKPKPYQRRGSLELLKKPSFGLLYDPGLGKTATVLHAIKALHMIGEVEKVLLIAPRLVCLNTWPQEIKKWNQFKNLSYCLLKDTTVEDGAVIHLINPEVSRLEKVFEQVEKQGNPYDMLVVDESTKFKNPSSKRFDLLKKYIPQFPRRVILTGTFAPNSLQDVFSQMYILDNGETFGKFITHFRNRYFVLDNPKFYTYKLRDKRAAKHIKRGIAPWVLRLDKKDHLELPPIIFNPIKIELSKKVQKGYDDLEKDLYGKIKKKEILLPNASMKYLKCRQVVNGFIKEDDEITSLHIEKVEALQNLLEELEGKNTLVVYQFRHDVKLIRKAIGKNTPNIGGETTEKQAQVNIKKWNAKKIPVLLVQPASVAHGLNLQSGGNHIIFFALTDHLEDYEQLIARIHRQGVEGSVFIHYILMENTIDEVLYSRIKRKEKKERSLLKDLEKYLSKKHRRKKDARVQKRIVRNDANKTILQAPFPWFGGKRKVADEVWTRFGEVRNYVEPFFGSGAVLLGRPDVPGIETINDLDGYVANFWRSIKLSPELTAEYADQPVNENDLHARHVWLVKQKDELRSRLEGDPDWHDPKIAGWWVWGLSSWIGGGFCVGKGPWWPDDNGMLVKRSKRATGVDRKRPHLSGHGQGVNRQRPQLGNAGTGVNRIKFPFDETHTGVSRQLPHLRNHGQGVNRIKIPFDETHTGSRLLPWFDALSARLKRVRVCSGDWSRVCGKSPTYRNGLTGVFLDPPYADTAKRDSDLYRIDSESVAHDVRKWAIENGENPKLRIALCGYDGEHIMPDSWKVSAWKTQGGYGNRAKVQTGNKNKERIWYSPACLQPIDSE